MRKVGFVVLVLLSVNELKAQWVQMPFPTSDNLNGIAFCNADTGFVVATNKVYRTLNGGQSWTVVATAPSPHGLFDIAVPKFGRNSGVVVAVGGLLSFSFNPQTQDVRNIVMRSTDYGTSWTTTINGNGIGESRLEYVYVLRDSISFVMGSCGPYISNNSFKKTTNGGQSWNPVNGAAVTIYDSQLNIDFVSSDLGYIGGQRIIKTINQGNDWLQIAFISNIYSNISFVSEQIGYTGADAIYKTIDSGINWVAIDTVWGGLEMCFTDSITGYVTGENGLIYKTISGGEFQQQTSPTNKALYGIHIINKDTLYIIGNGGTILKTINGGGHLSTSETLKFANEFRLEQNYPNPFNPTTTIKYSITRSSIVSLKVYDMLGREIKNLVNERKAAGSYQVRFEGSNLASGIYFYRLVIKDFSLTRKMVLTK